MDISQAELAIIFGAVIAVVELLKKGLSLASQRFKKDNKDDKQEVQLAVFVERFNDLEKQLTRIETNDLAHNAQEHKEMKCCLEEIKISLAVIKDKLK